MSIFAFTITQLLRINRKMRPQMRSRRSLSQLPQLSYFIIIWCLRLRRNLTLYLVLLRVIQSLRFWYSFRRENRLDMHTKPSNP